MAEFSEKELFETVPVPRPVAALAIPAVISRAVKRIDQFPLNVSRGLCQGFMPLVGYNYAAGKLPADAG